MKIRYLPLLLPLLAFAAERPQIYTCDDGSRLEILLSAADDERPAATLQTAEGKHQLPMVPAAAGALFRAGPLRLHLQDDEAVFDDGQGRLRRCTKGEATASPSHTATPAATDSFVELSGQVTYYSRMALPPSAILSIRIRDRSRARPLVEQRYELNGAQVPIAFSATVDRDLIGRRSKLSVSARIEHGGRLLFASDKDYPLFENGQAHPVDIVLKPAPGKRTR